MRDEEKCCAAVPLLEEILRHALAPLKIDFFKGFIRNQQPPLMHNGSQKERLLPISGGQGGERSLELSPATQVLPPVPHGLFAQLEPLG